MWMTWETALAHGYEFESMQWTTTAASSGPNWRLSLPRREAPAVLRREAEAIRRTDGDECDVGVIQFGWPFRAMHLAWHVDQWNIRGGVRFDPFTGSPRILQGSYFPLRFSLWLTLCNVGFFSVAYWGGYVTYWSVRGWCRTRAGRCIACGYPSAGDVCSECGLGVRANLTRNTMSGG